MDIEAGPILIVAGVSNTESTATHELKRRGFIIKQSFTRKGSLYFAVSMSKRLIAKLAAENNVPIQPICEYTALIQTNLANHATHIIMSESRRTETYRLLDCSRPQKERNR